MRVKKLLSSILAICLMLSTMSFAAYAETPTGVTVAVNETTGTSYNDLSTAVSEAAAGDIITLYADVETLPTIDKPLTIKGADGITININGAIAENFPNVEGTVAFENLAFNNRISTENASNDQSNMTLKFVRCKFNVPSGNTYAIQGGASWNNDYLGGLHIEDCVFATNAESFTKGYFVYAQCVGTVTVSTSEFDGNNVLRGAIHTGDSTEYSTIATITGNTISNIARGVQVANRTEGSIIEVNNNTVDNVGAINGESESALVYIHEVANSETTDIKIIDNDISLGDGSVVVFSENTTGSVNDFVVAFTDNTLDDSDIELDGNYSDTKYVPAVAKVGDEEYTSIDEAIAAWTNETTLTLLADVQLSDVVKLKSTEHHKLNLGTYTMTAADGKNALEIIAYGTGNAERYAITITADVDNPGTLNAGKKSCIYYDYSKGQTSGNDRPIIKIEGGIFEGSTSSFGTAGIYARGTAARKCATFNISGGTFDCSVLGTGKSKMLISGGTFNYSVGSQGDSTCYRLISGGTFKSFGWMTADAVNKFGVGSALGTYDIGVYVDDNGYLVVGGSVVTEPGTTFVASTDNHNGWNSMGYLKYSSAASNDLYYTSAEEIFSDCKKGTITLYEDCDVDATASGALTIDCSSGVVYNGDIELKSASSSIKVILPEDGEYTGIVKQYGSSNYLVANEDIVDGKKVITYTQTSDPVGAGYNVSLIRDNTQTAYEFSEALTVAIPGDTIKLLEDVVCNIDTSAAAALLALEDAVTIDLNWKKLSPADPELPTFVAGKSYIIKNGTIEGDVVVNGGDLVIENVSINGDFTVKAGTAKIKSGNVTGSIASIGEAVLDITGGKFTEDPTAYVSDGYDVIRHSEYYAVANLSEEAKSISVEFEKTDIANDEDNLEGKDIYNIVFKANNGDEINELASADLTFKFIGTPVTGGAMDYTIVPAAGIALTQIEDRFMFNYDGVTKFEESGTSIVIGTLTIEGYGAYTFQTVDATTNVVNATTVFDNLVDYYIKDGDKDASAATGGLVINTDTDTADKLIGEITDDSIAVPTRELTINIDFPNAVNANTAAYQDMKVEITGNIEGVNKTVTYDLGETMVDGSYVVTEDRLVLNNAYTVTVSGAGYRTARYTVTMTEDKTLRFWNNVRDEAQTVEVGKETGEVNVTFLAGDIVKDNNINIYDLSAVVSYFATETDTSAYSEYAKYDLNRDGVIDSKDVAYVLVSWGN